MASSPDAAIDGRFVAHDLPEQQVALGEVAMNYATAGADRPALLLLPSQTESWWGYEPVISRLADHFQVYAVDLRGQGRSTCTPGRYTLDNMGDDLVRFLDLVVGRPAIVSGNSSGGVLATWLSAYAKPGQIRGVVCEDPPLFASETEPAIGHSIRQAMGPLFALTAKWLGDQWSIGNWAGLQGAMRELPPYILRAMQATRMGPPAGAPPPSSNDGPPQNMREYDPEWGRSFASGAVAASCDHARMLSSARTPVLITHHFHAVDETSGCLMGAASDEQITHARELVRAAGQPCEVIDLPEMGHQMHALEPERFTATLVDWARTLPDT